jgi:RES domain-containing protein
MPALYTSLRRATALAEATQLIEDDDPIKPMLMLSVKVSSARIADLTEASTLKKLGTTRAELGVLLMDKSGGTAPSQVLGRVAYETASIDGLLVWSRVADKEKNLIIFPDRLNTGYTLYDPGHDLPTLHPAIAEAMNVLMQID